MIKVLFIVAPAVSYADNKRGVNGPERRSANVIEYWKNYDIHPVYAYPQFGKLYDIFLNSNYQTIDFYIKSKFDFLSIFKLIAIIKKNQIDVVHTQGPGSLDMMSSIACKLTNVDFVFTRPVMLDDLKVNHIKRFLFNMFDNIAVMLSRKIIAVSTDGETRLKKRYPKSSNKVVKIFNGINLLKVNARENVESNFFVLSMCAQLTINKGWFDFIEACQKLIVFIPKLKVNIVGDGPLYDEIKKNIKDNKLDEYIHMVGHTDNVYKYLSQTDVYVMTSYREGLSVAVIEALASGLPVVAYSFSGSDDQVENGVNGYVVKMGDIDSIVDSVLTIYDHNLLNVMGRKSRDICESKFSEKVMVEKYVNIYKDIIDAE